MEFKICSKCKLEKEVCNFYILKKSSSQYRPKCKKCMIEECKIYQENNKELILKRGKIYRENNKEIIKGKIIEYYKSNPEKYNERKKYSEEHRKKNLKYYSDYHKHRIKNDVNFRLIKILRSGLNKIIHNNNLTKTNKTTEFLGCNVLELKNHLECQFKEGMSWDNHGLFGWHIDHIKPLSSAKTEKELYILCHYTNLQPLWAKDNLSKGNKIL
jgi:hypothetical protein